MLTGANNWNCPNGRPNGSGGRGSVRTVKQLTEAVYVQSISDRNRKDVPFGSRSALCYVFYL